MQQLYSIRSLTGVVHAAQLAHRINQFVLLCDATLPVQQIAYVPDVLPVTCEDCLAVIERRRKAVEAQAVESERSSVMPMLLRVGWIVLVVVIVLTLAIERNGNGETKSASVA